MKKMNEFDNILDECLQRLIAGESIEACLSRYPEHTAELESLLRTAQNTLNAADIKPRPEFRDRARYQFQAAIREMPVKERRDFFAVLRPSLASVIVMVVVLLAGGGVVAAAGGSLPDSPLYQVKLATEAVRLALTPSDLGKAELNARFADERIDEIIKMADKGNVALVEETTDRMNSNLIAVANLTGTGEAFAGDVYLSSLQAPAAMTPVPTMTPTTVPAPSPTVKTSPSVVLPTPAITTPPPEEGVSGEGNPVPEDTLGHREVNTKEGGDKQEKLRDSLAQQYAENIQALQAELEKASEPLKSALRHAIEVAENAYAQALENLFN
jgi:hypothetical protein